MTCLRYRLVYLYRTADRVADPRHFNADPDPDTIFSLKWRIRIRFFTLMRIQIWILLLIKVMRISDYWSTDPPRLYLEPPRLHCELLRPSTPPFWSFKALNFADPDPAFFTNADPDPKIMRIGSGSTFKFTSIQSQLQIKWTEKYIWRNLKPSSPFLYPFLSPRTTNTPPHPTPPLPTPPHPTPWIHLKKLGLARSWAKLGISWG
jgi:hypothetical protein